jgi:osmotically-inducible protein OsmY
MGRLRRKVRPLVLISAGAAAAYFGDPQLGRTRRVKTKDQVLAACRRAARRLEQKKQYAVNTVSGRAQAAVRSDRSPPPVDKTLVDKVKSEVLGRPEFSGLQVVVDAAEGVVTVRGEVPDAATGAQLENAVAAVRGVQRVENLVHTPGQPAPNKETAVGA